MLLIGKQKFLARSRTNLPPDTSQAPPNYVPGTNRKRDYRNKTQTYIAKGANTVSRFSKCSLRAADGAGAGVYAVAGGSLEHMSQSAAAHHVCDTPVTGDNAAHTAAGVGRVRALWRGVASRRRYGVTAAPRSGRVGSDQICSRAALMILLAPPTAAVLLSNSSQSAKVVSATPSHASTYHQQPSTLEV